MERNAVTQLRRVLGRRDLLALSWGAMVGWGWVILAGSMAERAGTLGSAAAFAIGGVAIALVGCLYAELTAKIPRAGGELAFCFAGLGPRAAAACAWILCLAYLAVCAFEAVALPRVLFYLFPGLESAPLYHLAGAPVSLMSVAIGAAGVLAISLTNYLGIRSSAWLQGIGALILGLGGALLFATAVTTGERATMTPLFTDVPGLLSVLIMTPFLFVGFDVIPQVAEETRAGTRQVGAVILLAIGLATLWYASVQLSVGALLPATARSGAELAPVLAVETSLGSVWAGRVVLVGGVFGILTSWNAMFVGAVRLVFAMARGDMLPAAFARLDPRFATPAAAIAFLTVLSLLAPWFGRQALLWFVNAGAFATVSAYLLVALAYRALRKERGAWRSGLAWGPASGSSRWLGRTALVVTAALILLYVPGSPVALRWPYEWGIVIGWGLLGALLCVPRLRSARFDPHRAAQQVLGEGAARREY